MRLVAVLAVGLVALAAAGCGSGSDAATTAAGATAAPTTSPQTTSPSQPVACSRKTYPEVSGGLVTKEPPQSAYNSFPPTSGPYFTPHVPWDLHGGDVPEAALVKNLREGGIVVQVGERVPEDVVSQIIDWYLESPNGIVVTPLAALEDKVAVTAWRNLLTCDGFDEGRFSAFRDELRYKGPVTLPPEEYEPGK